MFIGDLPSEVGIREISFGVGAPGANQHKSILTPEVETNIKGDVLRGGSVTLQAMSVIGDGQLTDLLDLICTGQDHIGLPYNRFIPLQFNDDCTIKAGNASANAFDIGGTAMPTITNYHSQSPTRMVLQFNSLDNTHNSLRGKYQSINGLTVKVIAVNTTLNRMLVTPSIPLIDANGNDLIDPDATPNPKTIGVERVPTRDEARVFIVQRLETEIDQRRDSLGMQTVEVPFYEYWERDTDNIALPTQKQFDPKLKKPSTDIVHTQWLKNVSWDIP